MLEAVQKLLHQMQLTPAAAAGMTPLEGAKVALQRWLRERHMLVFLDDVWDQRIPELFQAASCQLLMTAEQCSVRLPDWQAVNLTPQMVHDSGVAAAILDAHNISTTELVSSTPAAHSLACMHDIEFPTIKVMLVIYYVCHCVQDLEAFVAECSFHPGLMLAAAKALDRPGGSVRAALRCCLEQDEEHYVQRARSSGSLQPADTQELLATMSLFPGGAFIPTAVVSSIHRRYGCQPPSM